MVKVVVDSNVLVSGLLFGGIPEKILKALRDKCFELYLSPLILQEVSLVLNRPKFHSISSATQINLFIRFLKFNSSVIIPKETLTLCRDLSDNHILACAAEARADFIVTGDKDLLVLSPFRKIPIITPKEFINFLINPN